MEIGKFIEANLENMKKDLARLVSFPSVHGEDEKPFGSANRRVLEAALEMMEQKGLQTVDVDHYAAYGQTGEGEKLIGILAHLDVVPCGEGWDSDPFTMTEKDGYLYGRGVSDDKGAAIASMYALKYLIDEGYPFKKRVRLILGCNEETGSQCIAHYVEKCGQIDLGFTPDGNFPGIFAEKGMVGAELRARNSKILSISGGEARNIVNKKVRISVPNDSFDPDLFKSFLDEHGLKYDIAIKDVTELTVHGVAAHASMPDAGINAIGHGLEALYAAGFDDPFVRWFHEHFALSVHGELLGYEALKDDISDTSINFGIASKQDDEIVISLDMRFPVKADPEAVVNLLKIDDENSRVVIRDVVRPLYFDQDTPMIKAFKNAYVQVTGDDKTPMEAIGGGTYAKSIANCIAFGCEFPGENNHIHDANECLNIASFKKQVELYVAAIRNLNEIAE